MTAAAESIPRHGRRRPGKSGDSLSPGYCDQIAGRGLWNLHEAERENDLT